MDDSFLSSNAGSISGLEDTYASSHFGSQTGSESGLLSGRMSSVGSVDDLESTLQDRPSSETDDESTYKGYQPEPMKEVYFKIYILSGVRQKWCYFYVTCCRFSRKVAFIILKMVTSGSKFPVFHLWKISKIYITFHQKLNRKLGLNLAAIR